MSRRKKYIIYIILRSFFILLQDEKEKEATENGVKNDNFLTKCSDGFKNSTNKFREKYKKEIRTFIYLLINVGFIVYFAFATKYFIDKGNFLKLFV